MKSTIFFKTNENYYMYDFNLRNYTLIHPLIHYFYWLEQQQRLPLEVNGLDNEFIPQEYNEKDICYYFTKYYVFKELGYFGEIEKKSYKKYFPEEIENALFNTRNIVFEVTDACNLRCKYCGYGDFYYDHDLRNNKYISFDLIKCFLDYFLKRQKSNINKSFEKTVSIGFYGGEPLLNFSAIEKTVAYLQSLELSEINFNYTITTNATLIHKYIDFLVNHDFKITISLDGSMYNHSYRTYHNGKNSHSDVLKNIGIIRNEYPDFYKNNISYNSVLHNRNTVEEVNNYIKMELDKVPRISPLNNSGIRMEKREEFKTLYNDYRTSLNTSTYKDSIIKERFIDDPSVMGLCTFLYWFVNNQYEDYTTILTQTNPHAVISTGTCIPFDRKVFITVNNKILACERISQEHVLGKIENDNVIIDFEQVANKYNQYFDNIYDLCFGCYRSGRCGQCILQFEDLSKKIECLGFQNESQFSQTIGSFITLLETHPTLFSRIINEITLK